MLERIKQAIAKKKEGGPQYYFNELPPTPTMFKFTNFGAQAPLAVPPCVFCSDAFTEAIGVLDLDSQEIARQITLFEFQHFSKITVSPYSLSRSLSHTHTLSLTLALTLTLALAPSTSSA